MTAVANAICERVIGVTHPRLISAIARDLFVDRIDVAAHKRFTEAPQTGPAPTPYQKAVNHKGRGDSR